MTQIFRIVLLAALTGSSLMAADEPRDLSAMPLQDESATGTRYGKADPMLGDISVGPFVTVVGFPIPFRFGIESKWKDILGLSADWGFFPSLTFSDTRVGYTGWNVAAKVYPFQRALYIGCGFGQLSFTGSRTGTFGVQSGTITIAVNATLLTPHLGWRWIGKSGFFYGFELGAQFTLSSTANTTQDNPAIVGQPGYAEAIDSVNSAANTLARQTLPILTIAQFGWML